MSIQEMSVREIADAYKVSIRKARKMKRDAIEQTTTERQYWRGVLADVAEYVEFKRRWRNG